MLQSIRRLTRTLMIVGTLVPLSVQAAPEVSAAPAKPLIEYAGKQGAAGQYFIRLNTANAVALKAEDRFQVRFEPQGTLYTARVDSVSSFEGMQRITGQFLNQQSIQPDDNQFSLTLNQRTGSASGNFVVGGRGYTLEQKQGLGWVNSLSNEQHLMEKSGPDGVHK